MLMTWQTVIEGLTDTNNSVVVQKPLGLPLKCVIGLHVTVIV